MCAMKYMAASFKLEAGLNSGFGRSQYPPPISGLSARFMTTGFGFAARRSAALGFALRVSTFLVAWPSALFARGCFAGAV